MIKYEDTSDGTQKVTITYFGNEEPDVVVTDRKEGSAITIELIDARKWLFLKHNGVSIYHTERHQDIFSDHWFSPVRGQDSDTDLAFEAHDLEPIPKELEAKYEALFPIADNQEANWKKQRMAYAIDQEKLSEEGLE